MTLPQAAWRTREGLTELCDVLGAAEGKVRFVGGAVRDTLIGYLRCQTPLRGGYAKRSAVLRATLTRFVVWLQPLGQGVLASCTRF